MFNKVLINRDAILNNIKQIKQKNPNSKFCAMVKANAYGVGLKEIVSIIDKEVDFFGVSNVVEAREVRNLTNKKILIVGATNFKEELDSSFSYTCTCLEDVKQLVLRNKPFNIHLKINTGMNRYGIKSLSELKRIMLLIQKSSLILEGVFTHFATCDEYVNQQFKQFVLFVDLVKKKFPDCLTHTDNSCVNKKFNHNLNMVRIGFDLYNYDINNESVQILSQIVAVQNVNPGELVGYDNRFVATHKMKVAVVPIGYADGFDLKNIGMSLQVNKYRCRVLNVCMDCFMLDITKTKIKKGDVLFVLNKNNSLNKYSEFQNVSTYQILTNFSKIRAERLIISSK